MHVCRRKATGMSGWIGPRVGDLPAPEGGRCCVGARQGARSGQGVLTASV